MLKIKVRNFEDSRDYWALKELQSWGDIALPQGEARGVLTRRLTGWTLRRDIFSLKNEVDSASIDWVREQNPWLEAEEAWVVKNTIADLLHRGGEKVLFPRYALNAFLAEKDEAKVYGTFVTEHLDELLEAMENSKVAHFKHSLKIFNTSMSVNSVFLLRLAARRETAEAVENLTLAEVRLLMTFKGKTVVAEPSGVKVRIEALLTWSQGLSQELPKKLRVRNRLNLAFVRSFAHEKNIDLLKDAFDAYYKELNAVVNKTFEDPTKVDAGLISTALMSPAAEKLALHAHKLRFYELFALVRALRDPALVIQIKQSCPESFVLLLLKASEESEDDFLSIIKTFADVIVSPQEELPTLERWIEGVKDGSVAGSLTTKTTLFMLSDKVREPLSSVNLKLFRREVNRFI